MESGHGAAALAVARGGFARTPILNSPEEEAAGGRVPPGAPQTQPTIPADERRLQLHAYDLWTGLLGNFGLPSIEDLEPAAHPTISPNAVLLDFTRGNTDPQIAFLGESLAQECGVAGKAITRISQLPEGSLLARIAEHYMQSSIDPEPIGFEAEFINQRDREILYRGILLPFSRNRASVDFVFGVVNWKELAGENSADPDFSDGEVVDELLLELSQVIAFAEPKSGPRTMSALLAAALDGLPVIEEAQLQAIGAAGGEVALVAIARSADGDSVVLGEVRQPLHHRTAISARR